MVHHGTCTNCNKYSCKSWSLALSKRCLRHNGKPTMISWGSDLLKSVQLYSRERRRGVIIWRHPENFMRESPLKFTGNILASTLIPPLQKRFHLMMPASFGCQDIPIKWPVWNISSLSSLHHWRGAHPLELPDTAWRLTSRKPWKSSTADLGIWVSKWWPPHCGRVGKKLDHSYFTSWN